MSRELPTLIVGLGNYILPHTRHSIGMAVCDALASQYNSEWEYSRKYEAYVTSILTPARKIYLMKSNLAMNLNGKSVLKAVQDQNISLSEVVLLHDDLERELGKISWKEKGSAEGHNGVKSVLSLLKEDEIKRVRIGIGKPDRKVDVSDYVLSHFDLDEVVEAEEVVSRVAKMLEYQVIMASDSELSFKRSKKGHILLQE